MYMQPLSTRTRFALLVSLTGILLALKASCQTLSSPDKSITVTVSTGAQLTYNVQYKGRDVAKGNAISLTLSDGKMLGTGSRLSKKSVRSVNQTVKPLYGMASAYPDQFNELTLTFKEDFSVVFRVYNSGVAYRFEARLPGRIRVKNEQAGFNFSGASHAWMQSGTGHNFYEDQYVHNEFSTLTNGRMACLPFLVDAPVKATTLETDLHDYPCMMLTSGDKGGVNGHFLSVVLKDSLNAGNHFERIPYQFADYIAETDGTRNFPWRILVLAEHDKDLLYNNQMV